MKLKQLEYLVALRKYGSITKAADALYVTQPAISNGIRELEAELGCPLIIRNNRGIVFNKQGLEILDSAMIIMDEIRNIKALSRRNLVANDSLKLAAPFHLCNVALTSVALELGREHPELSCDLKIGLGNTLLEQLCNHELDFALVYLESISSQGYSAAKNSGFVFEPVFREPLLIACRHGHPLLGRQVQLTDLLEYPFVSLYNLTNSYFSEFAKSYNYKNTIMQILEPSSARAYVSASDSLITMSLSTLYSGNSTYPHALEALDVEGMNWDLTLALAHSSQQPADIVELIADKTIKATQDMLSVYKQAARLQYLYKSKS